MKKNEICPACGVPATYNAYTDWFEHADGSSFRECLARIHRGEVHLEERPDLSAKAPAGAPCELYRYFDAAGVLLYVGISLSAAHRAGQHRADKRWWSRVSVITIERLPTREQALAAERAAIIDERPLHNVVHNQQNAGAE